MYTADGHVAFMSMASAPANFAVDDIRGNRDEHSRCSSRDHIESRVARLT